MKRAHTGVIIVSSLIIFALLVGLAYLVWGPSTKPRIQDATSFETCVAAGYPLMESYPPQCRDGKTGVLYVEKTSSNDASQPTTRSFTSSKGVTIELDNWTDNKLVESPLTLSGQVPGSWAFEASFPVLLKNNAGVTIAQGVATLRSDWMTDDLVPFTVTFEFTKPEGTATGSLVLKKDNPSGLVENEDSLTVLIRYK